MSTGAGVGTARDVALDALLAVARGPIGAQDALAQGITRAGIVDARDRGLATMLVFGTLRWQRTIDHALLAFAHRGLGSLDAPTLEALRLAVFQIRMLDRIPARAAVSVAVDQVRARSGDKRAGFANGLLRSLLREPHRADPPAGSGTEALGVRYSLPDWVVQVMIERYGDNAEALCAAYAEPAPTVVRCRLDPGTRADIMAWLEGQDGVTVRAGQEPTALVLEGVDPLLAPPFEQGLWLSQDEGAQRIARLLGALPGQRVLDLCAGSGVKTMYLAEAVGPGGRVVAVDQSARKLERLVQLAQRWRVEDRIDTAALDATGALPFEADFDAVLVDAPCTGLGTIRRRPEIKWRRRPNDVHTLAATQRALLDRAAAVVRPGGALLYAVCTFTREECEGVIRGFLSRHGDFQIDPIEGSGEDGIAHTSPLDGGMDGFAMARFVRQS